MTQRRGRVRGERRLIGDTNWELIFDRRSLIWDNDQIPFW